jgi:sterol desaturase/sphingolipid hydroxylase (fatty acid hydroxylase superfamily)
MHIWHHAKKQPTKYGTNFGLSLSIWDYLFRTAHVPSNGRDVELGFNNDDTFPKNAVNQLIWPIGKGKNKK